jgi:hypothetical protein
MSAFAVEEARDAVDARGRLATEDLPETPAEDRVDLVEARAGMAAVCLLSFGYVAGLVIPGIKSHLNLSG